MAQATLIFEIRQFVETLDGMSISIHMDLFKINEPHDPCFPEGFRFSWIAYEEDAPENRVLFDCHSPKGPHIHVDRDEVGTPFEWKSLADAKALFFLKVIDRFGEIPKLREVKQ